MCCAPARVPRPVKYKSIFDDVRLERHQSGSPPDRTERSPALPATLHRSRQSRYPNPKWLPPPLFETISKIEGLTDEEFLELMGPFSFV
jgi:hypothetical protein